MNEKTVFRIKFLKTIAIDNVLSLNYVRRIPYIHPYTHVRSLSEYTYRGGDCLDKNLAQMIVLMLSHFLCVFFSRVYYDLFL